jgi:dipeptidyl aminopeptidase/acylaminoacyl peptidase
VELVVHDLTPSIVSARLGVRQNSRNKTSTLPAHFESNSLRHCIQSGNEIAVASDAFNGTLLTPLLSLMNMLCRFFSLSITIVVCSLATAPAQNLPNTTRLLRFPTTNDQDIVFCYAGQLYTVGKDGGTARRLTSGPGYTSFSRFSPDGTQIAFTSEYDGNREVYVMPAEGGVPKRLTTSATLGRDDV